MLISFLFPRPSLKSVQHTTHLQQTTLKTISKEYGNSILMKGQLLNQVENVAKGEIAHYDQCLLLSQRIQVVCCRCQKALSNK